VHDREQSGHLSLATNDSQEKVNAKITQTFFWASQSLRSDQEIKDVMQVWLEGLGVRLFGKGI
jgi:hypothetical protein